MTMLGFRKKTRAGDEIDRLHNAPEENPEDTRSKRILANLYLENGDQEKAIREYHTAAEQLSTEGLDLEPIAIYRKILSLGSPAVAEKSLASVREAEKLLSRAKRAYEEILGVGSTDDMVNEDPERPRDLQEELISIGDRPVRLDMPRDQPEDSPMSQIRSFEGQSPSRESSSPGASPSIVLKDASRDHGGQKAFEFAGTVVEEKGVDDSVRMAEINPATRSCGPTKHGRIDLREAQLDDDLETMLSDSESETFIDHPFPSDTSGGPSDEGLYASGSGFQDAHLPEESFKLGATDTVEDPDLPYNLGIAYYEMDLTDKAIREFVRAHNQGTKPVKSLSMLAKCYCKKGLFRNAAGLVVHALKLDNLTQEQIDMLQTQLDEIGGKIRATDSPYSRQLDPQKESR